MYYQFCMTLNHTQVAFYDPVVGLGHIYSLSGMIEHKYNQTAVNQVQVPDIVTCK